MIYSLTYRITKNNTAVAGPWQVQTRSRKGTGLFGVGLLAASRQK